MKRLYLVRHGETLFNTQGKIQGWSDSPLTERGIKQAQAVRDYFGSEGIRFDHAYSSTSERASDTLELITGMPYARLKGLKEVNYGFFEGEREMLKPKEPQEIVSFFVPFGGENTNDVAERVAKDVDGRDGAGMTIRMVLAVSHSGACYNFLKLWQDPAEELAKGFPNGSIFVYGYKEKVFRLEEVVRPVL
ncbi:MAG: histidine phosphatase family protein [Trichococcus flocculiformis]